MAWTATDWYAAVTWSILVGSAVWLVIAFLLGWVDLSDHPPRE